MGGVFSRKELIDIVDPSLHTEIEDYPLNNKEAIALEKKCRHLGGTCITLASYYYQVEPTGTMVDILL